MGAIAFIPYYKMVTVLPLQFSLWTLFDFSLLIKYVLPRWVMGPVCCSEEEDESTFLTNTCEVWIHLI